MNVVSPVESAVSLLVTVVIWGIYTSISLGSQYNIDRPALWTQILSNLVEKQLPVVLLAIFAGYTIDSRQREMYLKTESIKKQRSAIQTEQEKNKLLLSLPKVILDGLLQNKKPVIDAYGTVLFADIVSFTVFSGMVEPFKLVQILDDMFEMHDDLANKLSVDKVKTLGGK